MLIYVVKNIAMETAGYFSNRVAAEECAKFNANRTYKFSDNEYKEEWFVIEVKLESTFVPIKES